jgi:hypothetical protein
MDLDEENNCLVFTNGTQYCNNNDNQLRTFVNGNSAESISDYIINDNDRLLVIYGNETDDQISKAVKEVNDLEIQYT